MERLIKNLGCSYDHLIGNNVISNHPLQSLYDDETLEIELVPGIELVFCPETLRFELLYITLKTEQDANGYEGDLPSPFNGLVTQEEVHQALGKPIFSKKTIELQGTGLSGWDTYQLPSEWHHAAIVEFQYVKKMILSKILFSLIDRNI
ncbi:DUF6392 family protein [Pseudomonas fulva]|uniref:DUF6392 family protein n=1 Tax=Pseudomonas fulva TaxID=47880 RepID=UPI002DB756BE|nr:DUF6392 family protein [Pseudomonas fulva]MEB8059297.1 DUF6392 family protein [Pseudomonas fulva]